MQTTIKGLYSYIIQNSGFSSFTVRSVISSLGYKLNGTKEDFFELSGILSDCSKHGADCGFSGFIYYSDTIKFYRKHRQDIILHMENLAVELGLDIISLIQGFGIFRNSQKPTASEISKALWENRYREEHHTLYNVFAWYTLEEIAHTWYRHIEDNPELTEQLSA